MHREWRDQAASHRTAVRQRPQRQPTLPTTSSRAARSRERRSARAMAALGGHAERREAAQQAARCRAACTGSTHLCAPPRPCRRTRVGHHGALALHRRRQLGQQRLDFLRALHDLALEQLRLALRVGGGDGRATGGRRVVRGAPEWPAAAGSATAACARQPRIAPATHRASHASHAPLHTCPASSPLPPPAPRLRHQPWPATACSAAGWPRRSARWRPA